MIITRRRFVQSAIATSAAYGFAPFARADESLAKTAGLESVVDTHVYVGDWPHKSLANTSPKDLAAKLQDSNVSQAWVGNFDGLFHKDVGGGNRRLAEVCQDHGKGVLVPFGTVNPTLPDWEEDVRRCHEDLRMPGIRLHPQYHGYTLDDPRFASLLQLAATSGLVVQLVAWMEDEKHRWLSPRQSEAELKPLRSVLAQVSNLKLVIANCRASIDTLGLREASPKNQYYYDFGRLNNTSELRKTATRRSADRFVFGSGAPLHDAARTRLILSNADLNADERTMIANRNATKLLDAATTSSRL